MTIKVHCPKCSCVFHVSKDGLPVDHVTSNVDDYIEDDDVPDADLVQGDEYITELMNRKN